MIDYEKIQKEIAALSNSCFEIEEKLPLKKPFEAPADEGEILRLELYRLRIRIGQVQGIAKICAAQAQRNGSDR